MGGVDKAFATLGGETLLARTIARAKPQVAELLINANGDSARFSQFGLPVLADRVEGFLGPLAGILTGLEWMRANRPEARWLATFSCDSPFLSMDLVGRLVNAAEAEDASVAVASSNERLHPVFAVWRADIEDTPQSLLDDEDMRKVEDFIALFDHVFVKFASEPVDPFFNINTPDDLARAETLRNGID